jgi:hypothetical protein
MLDYVQGVSKELYSGIPNVPTSWVLLKRLHLKAYKISIAQVDEWTLDSLYAFKCKRFRNTRHTATFAILLL